MMSMLLVAIVATTYRNCDCNQQFAAIMQAHAELGVQLGAVQSIAVSATVCGSCDSVPFSSKSTLAGFERS